MSHQSKQPQTEEDYLENELYDEDERVAARLLLERGLSLEDVRKEMESYFDLDYTERKVFNYLLFDGGINDFFTALEQTKRIEGIDRIDAVNNFFNIPERLYGIIDYDKAWEQYRMEVSVFEIDGQYYIQED